MNGLVSLAAQKAGAALAALLLSLGGVLTGSAMPAPPRANIQETAIVSELAPLSPIPSSGAATGALVPGLLPKVVFAPPKKTAAQTAKAAAAIEKPVATTVVSATSTQIVNRAVVPKAITAEWLLQNTTSSFLEQRDGPYQLMLQTKTGDTGAFQWDLTKTVLGGTGGVPQFSVAYSCDPPPAMPPPGAFDQNPAFAVRTAYTCTLSLTPLAGADRRTQSRQFALQTDPGPVVISPPSAMNGVLANDTNTGGFVFTNEDGRAINVTGVTLDVSYTGLSTSTGPLVLRLVDGRTDAALADYHMENIPGDPARAFAAQQTGIVIPLAFPLGPAAAKLLRMNVLGVRRMLISGSVPTITIAVRSVSTAERGVRTILNSAQISWSCVVTLAGYDPNSTSSAFANGTACR